MQGNTFWREAANRSPVMPRTVATMRFYSSHLSFRGGILGKGSLTCPQVPIVLLKGF